MHIQHCFFFGSDLGNILEKKVNFVILLRRMCFTNLIVFTVLFYVIVSRFMFFSAHLACSVFRLSIYELYVHQRPGRPGFNLQVESYRKT